MLFALIRADRDRHLRACSCISDEKRVPRLRFQAISPSALRPRLDPVEADITAQPNNDPQAPPLPSLELVAAQVARERETMNAHAESLDTKAGVVLGFAGVLVGLGATAQAFVSADLAFQIGLAAAVLAALSAAFAFLPRKYPVIEVLQLREFLTAPEAETRLTLLDVQIDMVVEAAALVKRKGGRIKIAVALLAVAAALIVAGTLIATGGTSHNV